MEAVFGVHFVVELIECERAAIARVDALAPVLLAALRDANATVLESSLHQFEPEGASGTVLIAESHLSFHTWPESGYMSLDLFTCGESVDPERAIDRIRAAVGAHRMELRRLQRGY